MTKKAEDEKKIESMAFRLAHLIRRFRTTHKLSTSDLAEKMGVSKPMIEVYENTKDPRGLSSALKSILRLSRALDLSPSRLISIMDGEINEEQEKDKYVENLSKSLKKSNPSVQAYLKLLIEKENSLFEDSITSAWNFVKSSKGAKDYKTRIQSLTQINSLETDELTSLVQFVLKLKEKR